MIGQFIGKTSMGFKTGVIYELKSELRIIRNKDGINIPYIYLYDIKDKIGGCPYSSLEAVLKNWDFK